VDHQRHQIETFARCAEAFYIGWIGQAGAPLPGTGGEDLKGIRAQFVCNDRGVLKRLRDRSMDSYSQTAIVAIPTLKRSSAYAVIREFYS
jgi:hypothetical protein